MKKLFWLGCILCVGMVSSFSWAQDATQYLTAANQLYGAKDYTKAVQYYQAATQINPNSAEAYQGLGNCYYALSRNAEALTAYEKALQLNPGNAQLASFVNSLRAQPGTSLPAAASSTMPAVNAPSPSTAKTFELSFMAGVAQDLAEGGGMGFGGLAGGHYLINQNFGIGGTIGYRMFSSSEGLTITSYSGTITETLDMTTGIIAILGSAKYIFDGSEFRPFLVGGVGMSLWSGSGKYHVVITSGGSTVLDNTQDIPAASSSYPMVELGGGVKYSLGNNMALCGQVTYNVMFAEGGSSGYAAIDVGLAFDM